MYVNKFYNLLNVNNDALIVLCVAPEGLLTDHMSNGSLYVIAAIGGTIEDYRLSHKLLLFLQLIVQWCIMLCIMSTSTIKRIARIDSDQGLRHITSGSHGQYHRITVVLQ